MSENILEIRHLGKSFGTHEVLRDIDFNVQKGDVISIIGASGSGKSTLLRCINLLETPSSGQILYHGTDVAGRGVNAPAYRSHVGMVFQSFNLFNNMTVLKNCMVGQMKVLKRSKEEARQQATEVSGKGGYGPLHQCQAPADLRRPEAAGGHCPGTGHGPGGAAVRRTHLRAGPGDGGRGAVRHAGAGAGGHDHAGGHPRDGLRPGRQHRRWYSCIRASSASRVTPAQVFGDPQQQETRDFLARFRGVD